MSPKPNRLFGAAMGGVFGSLRNCESIVPSGRRHRYARDRRVCLRRAVICYGTLAMTRSTTYRCRWRDAVRVFQSHFRTARCRLKFRQLPRPAGKDDVSESENEMNKLPQTHGCYHVTTFTREVTTGSTSNEFRRLPPELREFILNGLARTELVNSRFKYGLRITLGVKNAHERSTRNRFIVPS